MNNKSDQEIINQALVALHKRRAAFPSVAMVEPVSGVLPTANLRNRDNWRAFFHQLVAVVVPILVTANVVTENMAAAWIPFVFAIVDNLLSVGHTVDRVRRAIYAGIGVLQAGGLLTSLLTSFAPNYVAVAGAGLAVVSAFLARFYTPTTTMVPSHFTAVK